MAALSRTKLPRKAGERGFSLLFTVLWLAVMLGMLGLAVDLGRMFIFKNELQTFADASALAACSKLDGSATGVIAANNVATVGPLGGTVPNGWNFDTVTISSVTTTYAATFSGTYDSYATASTTSPNSYRFLNLTASATMPMYLLAVLPGIAQQYTITANAVAGQMAASGISQAGLAPFAPDAHDPTDTTNFGWTSGLQYSLKWGNGNSTTCAGDAGFDPGNAPSEHGFVDIGEGNGTSGIRDAIVNTIYPNASSSPSSVSVGDTLSCDPGNRGSSIFSATSTRAGQDTDQTSLTYAAYKAAGKGNGRRILVVPVADPSKSGGNGKNGYRYVTGFASFFLAPGANISGNSGALCAEYISRATVNGTPAAGPGTSIYTITLFR